MQKIRTQRKALRPGLLFAEEKGYSPDIVIHEAKELDEKLFRRGEKKGWLRLRATQFAGNESVPGLSFKGSRQQHFHCQGQRVCQQSQSTRELGYSKHPRASKALTTED